MKKWNKPKLVIITIQNTLLTGEVGWDGTATGS